jgi:diguanylate cyclase (GGDEF)-like protein
MGTEQKDLEIQVTAPRPEDQRKDKDTIVDNIGDALYAAAYAGVQQPIDGVVQLGNAVLKTDARAPVLLEKPTDHDGWTTAGSLVGHVMDFYVLSKGVRRAGAALGKAETVPVLETATAGALFELSRPVEGDDILGSKFKNAAIGFGTFGSMDGANIALRRLNYFNQANTFAKRVSLGGLSGGAGGLTHSVLDSGLNDKPLTWSGVGTDVATFGAFGAMFGGLDHGISKAHEGISTGIQARIAEGKPLFSVGPLEVHPRGFAQNASDRIFTDNLTGLKNKAGGDEVLSTEVARAARQGEPLSLTYLDLDNFKTVNDKLGHHKGDDVLREVAAWLRKHFSRGTDKHVREGGDEFMVVMPNTTKESAAKLADDFEREMRIGVTREGVTPQQIAANFRGTAEQLANLPRVVEINPRMTHEQVAKNLIMERLHLTGETMNAETVAKEVARLRARTGIKEGEFKGNETVQVYTNNDIANFVDDASFRFLPQIGQLLKNKNVATEAQIQEVMGLQALTPPDRRPLIGELLVGKGYSTREQINAAFAEQGLLRRDLQNISKDVLGASTHKAAPFTFTAPNFHTSLGPIEQMTPSQIMAFRGTIPLTYRPMLDPNGVRRLQLFERPVEGEIVVGASSGVVQYEGRETAAAFKHRGDQLMFDKKQVRKEMGLRRDRHERESVLAD